LLCPDDRPAQAALGFLTVGGHFMNNTHDIIDDRMDVVTRGLMGLTVTCARCHDHKFDPIPAADYYSLYGVLRSSTEPSVPPLAGPPPKEPEHQLYDAELAIREKRLVDFVTAKTQRPCNRCPRSRRGVSVGGTCGPQSAASRRLHAARRPWRPEPQHDYPLAAVSQRLQEAEAPRLPPLARGERAARRGVRHEGARALEGGLWREQAGCGCVQRLAEDDEGGR